MYQTQVTKNGLVRIPEKAQDALKIYAGAQVTVEVRDARGPERAARGEMTESDRAALRVLSYVDDE